MAEKVLKKFVIGLGSDNKKLVSGLGEADKLISSFVANAKGALAGIGLGVGLSSIVKSFADFGNDLALFNKSTGISVENVSQLGGALELFGGDVETAKSALQGLQDAAREAVDWGTGPLLAAARKYGVMLQNDDGSVKDAMSLYTDLADVFGRLSHAQQLDLGGMLGLDQSSILLLQEGKTGIQELMNEQKKLLGITAEDALMGREWAKTMTQLKQTLTAIAREIARALLPAMTKVAKFAKELAAKFRENREAIEKVAQVIKNNLVPAFAFAAARVGKAMLPLIRSLAPLIAIALLIDDIAVFMRNDGGKSILGELLGDKGDGVRQKLTELFNGFKGIISSILTGDFEGAFEQVKTLWNNTIRPMVEDFGLWLWQSIEDWAPKIRDSFADIVTSAIFGLLGFVIDVINGVRAVLGKEPITMKKDGTILNGQEQAKQWRQSYDEGVAELDRWFLNLIAKADSLLTGATPMYIDEDWKPNAGTEKSNEDLKRKKREAMRAQYEKSLQERPSVNPPPNITNSRGGSVTQNIDIKFISNVPVDENSVSRGIKSVFANPAIRSNPLILAGLVATGGGGR